MSSLILPGEIIIFSRFIFPWKTPCACKDRSPLRIKKVYFEIAISDGEESDIFRRSSPKNESNLKKRLFFSSYIFFSFGRMSHLILLSKEISLLRSRFWTGFNPVLLMIFTTQRVSFFYQCTDKNALKFVYIHRNDTWTLEDGTGSSVPSAKFYEWNRSQRQVYILHYLRHSLELSQKC